ncbi:MAG TPA: hypothetical protein VFF28_06120 [Candidatus Nanoarchaeia archaeon]|nr:hypothetical protein [Candidatus Nanoarchaeia archaeon]
MKTLLIFLLLSLIAGCSQDCDTLEKEIKDRLSEANYCDTAEDCTFTSDFGCPFDCYVFYNKAADITDAQDRLASYKKEGCDLCVYSCIEAPDEKTIRCIDNKCVDTRINSSENI